MSRTLRVTGDHVKLASFVLQIHDFHFFRSMYKTIIRFGFYDIQNKQGFGQGYRPQPSASADNPYLDLDYSGYHKILIK